MTSFKPEESPNLVERMVSDEEQCETACSHGNLVVGHSVYCHNEEWEESPRKCRRTWYTGGQHPELLDERCPGFKPNPSFPEGSVVWLNLHYKGKTLSRSGGSTT